MQRIRVLVTIFIADDDQTDDEAAVEAVSKWVDNGIEKDRQEYGTDWPERWTVELD